MGMEWAYDSYRKQAYDGYRFFCLHIHVFSWVHTTSPFSFLPSRFLSASPAACTLTILIRRLKIASGIYQQILLVTRMQCKKIVATILSLVLGLSFSFGVETPFYRAYVFSPFMDGRLSLHTFITSSPVRNSFMAYNLSLFRKMD